MKTIIIGCKVLERELKLAMQGVACSYPIIWIESGLHNTPSKLKDRLQYEIDNMIGDYDRILFTYGICGNAILGLNSRKYELVFPRVDDCITLLLGSVERRLEINSNERLYFLTKGWLEGELNIWAEYQYAVNKYGKECATEIYSTMLNHYKGLGVLDVGDNEYESLLREVEELSTVLALPITKIQVSVNYLIKLLVGPWDNKDFININKNTIIIEENIFLN